MRPRLIYHFLNDDELLRISNKIKEAEKSTAGEVCVTIREHRHFLKRKKTIRELAEEEFSRIGIDKTRDKTGILIFILLEERQFYILADSGINQKVPENTWHTIKEEMQNNFSQGEFCKGILHGIDEVGIVLSKHFPRKSDDTNEISDQVRIEN